jgi:hypothetical protein
VDGLDDDLIADANSDNELIEEEGVLLSDEESCPMAKLTAFTPPSPRPGHPAAHPSRHPASAELLADESLGAEEEEDDGLVLAQLMKRAEGFRDRPPSPKRLRESLEYSQASSPESRSQTQSLLSNTQVGSAESSAASSSPEERK